MKWICVATVWLTLMVAAPICAVHGAAGAKLVLQPVADQIEY